MKYLLIIFSIVLIASCRNGITGSGNIITETRNVAAFTSISVSGSIKVNVKMGATTSVIVEADDNIMPKVISKVSGNNLTLKLEGINNLRNATVHINITVPMLNKVTTSASAEVSSTEVITSADKISCSASSASSIKMDVDAPTIFADGSSGADITLTGRTKNLTAESSSGSDVNLIGLQAENVTASASSGAEISLFASLGLKANASSGGNINYKGGAASVVKNVSSGGSVNPE